MTGTVNLGANPADTQGALQIFTILASQAFDQAEKVSFIADVVVRTALKGVNLSEEEKRSIARVAASLAVSKEEGDGNNEDSVRQSQGERAG